MSNFVYLLPESYALSKDNLKKEKKKNVTENLPSSFI